MKRRDNIEEARRLVDVAAMFLDNGQPDCAVWRLVDAAAMIADAVPDPLLGKDAEHCTGRGNYIGKVTR